MMIRNWFSKISCWVRSRVGFSKAALFLMSLVFSHSIVEYAVIFFLIDYFKDIWGEMLPKAASTVNMKEAFTAVMAILSAYIADTFVGRFGMVFLSTLAYIFDLTKKPN